MDNLITKVRSELGLSKEQLAASLGVHRSTVSRWESGARPVSGPAERLVEAMLAEKRQATQ